MAVPGPVWVTKLSGTPWEGEEHSGGTGEAVHMALGSARTGKGGESGSEQPERRALTEDLLYPKPTVQAKL